MENRQLNNLVLIRRKNLLISFKSLEKLNYTSTLGTETLFFPMCLFSYQLCIMNKMF